MLQWYWVFIIAGGPTYTNLFYFQMCSIDYDYVSDKFLQSLSACPQMTRLVIHVHGILDNHPGTTEYAWSNVCRNK